MSDQEQKGWCVLELMGHRKLAGLISEDEGLLRIDVYEQDPDEVNDADGPVLPIATQWYGRSAIYCITATTKENCIGLTQRYKPAPIGRYELPAPRAEEGEFDEADALDEDEVRY